MRNRYAPQYSPVNMSSARYRAAGRHLAPEAADLTPPDLQTRRARLSARSTYRRIRDWQPVALPDDWRRLGSDFRGRAGYWIPFHSPRFPTATGHLPAPPTVPEVEFFVRHAPRRSADLHPERMQATGFLILLSIPTTLLGQGENLLQVRMRAQTVANPRRDSVISCSAARAIAQDARTGSQPDGRGCQMFPQPC
jgi:hypothetical protein